MCRGRFNLAAIIIVVALQPDLVAQGAPLAPPAAGISARPKTDMEAVRWRYRHWGHFGWGRRDDDQDKTNGFFARGANHLTPPQPFVTNGRPRRWVDPPPE